jgi:hypothetical protein
MRIANLLTIVCIMTFTSCQKDPCKSSCEMEPDPGVCLAYIPKYFFNLGTGQCEEFTWGGCGGQVPFESLFECEVCDCQ